MSVVDSFLKKMKMVNDDEEDYDEVDYDYDEDYDDYGEDDEIYTARNNVKEEKKQKAEPEEEKYTEPVKKSAPVQKSAPAASSYSQASNVVGLNRSSSEIVGCRPESFEEAHTISDILLSGKGVFLNLEGIDMAQAQRIVDFAAGACYTVGGTLQRANNKIFIITPPGIGLSGEFTELQNNGGDISGILQ